MLKLSIPSVKHVVVIASGKGGVGKTTTAVNLALALKRLGNRVAVFDADIYGPNVPLLLGIHQKRKDVTSYVPIARPKDARPYIKTLQRFGIHLISVGLIVGEGQIINPVGDSVGMFVLRTMQDVIWPELDYLIIDMPPSSGEPQTSILNRLRLDGVVIVTTPQDMSLLDSSRAAQLFEQADVPILGIIENMSYFVCPNCDEEHEIFARSAAWQESMLQSANRLSRIPITAAISRGINKSHPLVRDLPSDNTPLTSYAQAYLTAAKKIADQLNN